MASKLARERAAQCWCDSRVSDRIMDSELCEVFAELLNKYIDALIACGHLLDFSQGKVENRWDEICSPLLN
jgi:hypothetical protein